jgi:tryptophan synthase beta chain
VIGSEIKSQTRKKFGRLPDAVVACVGGGSNAIGSFYPLLKYREVSLYGIEAGGEGLNTQKHSASLNDGTVGVLHGMKSYLLQDKFGQVLSTHSISAGLDYPGVGPEHAYLKDSGRVRYASRTDREAVDAFMALCKYEGIIPALESSHALAYAMKLAKKIGQDKNIIVTLSGRGDKDIGILFERNELSRYGVKLK